MEVESVGGMFDFNEDGKTDTGEQFIGYEIYKDVTSNFNIGTSRPVRKLDGITIFIIVILLWQVLTWIADLLY